MGMMELGVVVMAIVVVGGVSGQREVPLLPDIWKVVEDSYDSKLTIDFSELSPGTTMLVDEIYDIKEEQGMVEVMSRGTTTTNNYYTKSQQAFLVNDNYCSVGSIMMEDQYGIWGWIFDDSESSVGKQNFIYGPSALLRIVRDYATETKYMGEENVRGISSYHWTIYHRKNYTLDYYFSAEEWLMPYGHSLDGINLRAPIMVKVTGLQGNPWNVEQPEINQTVIYEYTEFKPYVEPSRRKRFLVREGLACINRQTLDPEYLDPPNAPEQFQVFLETVVRHRGSSVVTPFIFRSWLYYSQWLNLLRIDVNPGQDSYNPSAAYKSIHDYNTGIEYRIDSTTGECVMRPLEEGQLGSQVGSSTIGGIVLADPNKLFHLDDKYIFNGYSETRGIKSTRWTAERDDIYNPETGSNYKRVVVDYQFNSKEAQHDGEEEGTTLPIRVDTTVYFDNSSHEVYYRDTLNLLHMQTSFQEYDFNPFHVGECMGNPAKRTWLKIWFSGDWFHGAEQGPDGFKKKLLQYIVDKTGASFVRFPEIQLDYNMEKMVFATVLILEPAPYHLQFQQMADRPPTDADTKILLNMHDLDACAFICLTYTKFECKSFYKCNGNGRTCYLSNYNESPGKPVNVGPCPHYNRTLEKETSIQIPNEEIEVVLWEKIVTLDFVIEMEYTDHEGNLQTGKYVAFMQQNEIFSEDPILEDLVRDDFYVVKRKAMLVNKYVDLKLTDISYDKCLAKCAGQSSFQCETFSYCYDTKTCMLSSLVVNKPPDNSEIVSSSECVITVSAHTNEYTQKQGLYYIGEPKEVHQTVGVEKCAYLCDITTEYTCRAFDFCLDTVTCSLYDHHTADEPSDTFNASRFCTHYSRESLVDFTKHPNQVIEGSRDRYIKDTTVSACAKICVDEPDFGCNGFDYCNDDVTGITCFLTEKHYSDSGTEISNSLTCDHYSRDYYEGQDRNSYAHTKDTKYIYGPGDMAALGCSMLIISIGLTFIGIYVYNKYHK